MGLNLIDERNNVIGQYFQSKKKKGCSDQLLERRLSVTLTQDSWARCVKIENLFFNTCLRRFCFNPNPLTSPSKPKNASQSLVLLERGVFLVHTKKKNTTFVSNQIKKRPCHVL